MFTKYRARRARHTGMLALLLGISSVTTIALARPGEDTAGGGEATNTPSAAPASPVAAELQELKDEVRAQAKLFAAHSQELESERVALQEELARIESLEGRIGVAPDTAGSSIGEADPDSSAPPAQPQTFQNQGNVDRRLGNLEARLKKIGPLSFSGDFRFREEPFYGGPSDRSLDQNRQRIRLRFNTEADLGAGVTGGFSLASGDVNNPISTNQDVTAFYTRKPIALDKAFVQYNATFFKPLTLVAGKFGYNWFNTELTWDKDLNPEGLGQTLAFDLKSTPVLKRVAFVGFELPFSQVSGVSLQNKSLVQSVTYGGQVQTTWQLAPWLNLSAYQAFYNFHNADPIALALAKANSKNPVTPLSGALPLSAGSTTQNSITTTTAAGIVTVNGVAIPTGVSTITNAQFNSKFALMDSIARVDWQSRSERWPVTFIGDYVQNTEACANEKHVLPVPANTATATFSQSTNFVCNPDQRRAYWGEVQVGRILEKHDLQFGYTRMFIEREAVLSNFDYSEIRQGSAVTEHRASLFYTVNKNIVFDFIALIGRPINSSRTAPPEPWLSRLQFDVNYAF